MEARFLLTAVITFGLAILAILSLRNTLRLAQGSRVRGPFASKAVRALSLDKHLRNLPKTKAKAPHVFALFTHTYLPHPPSNSPDLAPHPGLTAGRMPSPLQNFAGMNLNSNGAGWPTSSTV